MTFALQMCIIEHDCQQSILQLKEFLQSYNTLFCWLKLILFNLEPLYVINQELKGRKVTTSNS